jgi:hypothetical protein
MNNRHPWQLKKSKSLGPVWRYQLNGNANLAHLAHFLAMSNFIVAEIHVAI